MKTIPNFKSQKYTLAYYKFLSWVDSTPFSKLLGHDTLFFV